MLDLFYSLFTVDFAHNVFRMVTPILFAALGALITARAGVINIAGEGMMLWSALIGVIISDLTNSLWIALLAGIAVSVLVSAIMAYFALKLKANIILLGIALNMFASAGTIVVLFIITGSVRNSDKLQSLQFPTINIPFIENLPGVGAILSGHNILTYWAVLCVFIVFVLIFRTPLGLRIRAVGENPAAAESVGIKVNKVRTYALLLSGFFMSFGGLVYSMGLVTIFSKDMTAGRGFIGLAAMNLGRQNPLGTFISSMIFGISDAIGIKLSVMGINADLVKAIPYAVTLIVLVIFSMQRYRKTQKIQAQL